jgi:NET1-associated nuclear protein 1 (U3 small nucleolar RNA-associated protein 17)
MDSDNTMASALKRKRASVEVIENLKRTKSTKNQPTNSLRQPDKSSAWDAAFNPPTTDRSTPTNGVNGKAGNGESDSPEAIDFNDFWDKEIQTPAPEEEERMNSINDLSRKNAQMQPNDEFESLEAIGRISQKKGSTSQALQKKPSKVTKKKAIELWKISEPIGGRLINVDPVFTADEKYATPPLVEEYH